MFNCKLQNGPFIFQDKQYRADYKLRSYYCNVNTHCNIQNKNKTKTMKNLHIGKAEEFLPTILKKHENCLLISSFNGKSRKSVEKIKYFLNKNNNTVFDYASPFTFGEPSLEAKAEALRLAKRVGSDAIIGVGGWSIMNLTKSVFANTKDNQLILIPTVSSGGAEASRKFELNNWEKHEKLFGKLDGGDAKAVVLDANLGLEDKIIPTIDLYQTLFTLTFPLHQQKEKSLVEEVSNHLKENSLAAVSWKYQDRLNSLLLSATAVNTEMEEGNNNEKIKDGRVILSQLTNMISCTIPLPKTLLRNHLYTALVKGNQISSHSEHLTSLYLRFFNSTTGIGALHANITVDILQDLAQRAQNEIGGGKDAAFYFKLMSNKL